jgi:hypothetical protein
MMNWKGINHGLIEDIIQAFAWRDGGKARRSSGQSVSRPRFELGTYRMRSRTVNRRPKLVKISVKLPNMDSKENPFSGPPVYRRADRLK